MVGEIEKAKKNAGEKALEFVEEGMILGLGTGSTVEYTIRKLADLIKKKEIKVVGIPTSKKTEKLAKSLNIPLSSLDEYAELDLCIDGADQVDAKFNLIKGHGGAHTREKIVATASKNYVIVVDYRKIAKFLNIPIPVEVLEFSKSFVEKKLMNIGGRPKLRKNFITDNSNLILDTKFEFSIKSPKKLELKINEIPGVVENGIFSKRKPEWLIVGYENKVEMIRRKQ